MAQSNRPAATHPEPIAVPNTPGADTTLQSNGKGGFGGNFIAQNFGEDENAKPRHLRLEITTPSDNPENKKYRVGKLVVDKFEKFTLSTNSAGMPVLTSKNGSTLTLDGITYIASRGDDGLIELEGGNVSKGARKNLATVDRTISQSESPHPAPYVGGKGNDYFDFGRFGAQGEPSKNVKLIGGGGQDTLYLDRVSMFTITNQGNGEFTIRSKNGSVMNLKGITGIENSSHGEGNDLLGCLSSVPAGKTVSLARIMNPKQGGQSPCKR